MMKKDYIAGGCLAVAGLVVFAGMHKMHSSITQYVDQRDVRRVLGDEEPIGAWFMHYPNSGGEHVIKLFQEITGKATGTNYGHTIQDRSGVLVKDTYGSKPIWEHHPNGPFKFNTGDVPDNYVPIATHCGGTCVDCHPQYYMLTSEEFWSQCSTGMKFTPFDHGKEDTVTYDYRLIAKGVQLVRPPLDNAVSRFKHLRTKKIALDDEVWLEHFPDNPTGFHMWCDDMSAMYREEENIKWPEEIWQASFGVPCRSEFFRYIQWHNYAHEATKRETMNIPLAVVHTRDLQEDFQTTMDHLIWFYRLNMTMPLTEYNALDLNIPGYGHDYYNHDQRVKIACFMKLLSSDFTLDRLGRYMTDCPN